MQQASNYNFDLEKQRAAERLRELNARSKYKTAESAESHTAAGAKRENRSQSILSQLHIPFLNDLGADSDIALILGLMLILTTEKSDKLLLLALLYILI